MRVAACIAALMLSGCGETIRAQVRALVPVTVTDEYDCARRPLFAGDSYDTDEGAAFLNQLDRWATACQTCCVSGAEWRESLPPQPE